MENFIFIHRGQTNIFKYQLIWEVSEKRSGFFQNFCFKVLYAMQKRNPQRKVFCVAESKYLRRGYFFNKSFILQVCITDGWVKISFGIIVFKRWLIWNKNNFFC